MARKHNPNAGGTVRRLAVVLDLAPRVAQQQDVAQHARQLLVDQLRDDHEPTPCEFRNHASYSRRSVAFCSELKRLFARMTFCRMSAALLVRRSGLGLAS